MRTRKHWLIRQAEKVVAEPNYIENEVFLPAMNTYPGCILIMSTPEKPDHYGKTVRQEIIPTKKGLTTDRRGEVVALLALMARVMASDS